MKSGLEGEKKRDREHTWTHGVVNRGLRIVHNVYYTYTRGERIVVFSSSNTNKNTIRVGKFDQIQTRILVVLFIMIEYEFEYYTGSEI